MKKVISALTAAAMCASMSASVMTAFAAYSANDVTMYLKAVETTAGTISEDGKTVTFATAADAANAKITIQSFINADTTGTVDIIGAGITVTSDSSTIVLGDGVDFAAAEGESKDYTLSSGVAFSTNMFVHCFGETTKAGKKYLYDKNADMTVYANSNSWDFWTANNTIVFKWNGHLEAGDKAGCINFIETPSDAYPFYQFSANLGEIADGTYTISYVDEWTNPTLADPVQKGTFVTAMDSTQTVTPGTGLTIVVGDPNAQTPTDPPATEPPATEPPATEPPATEPPATEPPATEPPTVNPVEVTPVDPSKFDKETLYFENIVYDRNSEDEGVDMYLKVAKNQATNAFVADVTIDGQNPQDVLPGFSLIYDCGFGFNLEALNPANGGIASALNPVVDDSGAVILEKSQKTLDDGSVVYTFWIDIPKDTPTGTYTFSLKDGAKFANYANEERFPDIVSGTLTITDGTDTPVETTEPPVETTEPPVETTEPPVETTEPPVETTEPPVIEPGDYIYGDVNHNGKVELVDIVMLNRFLTGFGEQKLDEYQTVVANCYRDNNEADAATTQADLNSKDSMEILRYLIGLVKSLPTNNA